MKNIYFAILILTLILSFWIWWLPGPRVANDFSFISNDWLKLQFDVPRAWNERGAEGLGEYGAFILWSYPINLVFGALTYIGLNFEIWERILVCLFIDLSSGKDSLTSFTPSSDLILTLSESFNFFFCY